MSTCRSSSLISISPVSFTTGATSTPAKLVWRRCAESNGDSRTSRCTPALGAEQPVGVLARGPEGRGLDARFLAGAGLEQLDLEAAPLGPAHQHPQHHLRPVLRVGPPRPRVHGDERVAGVVAAGEQPLLLERRQALLDRGDLLVDLLLQRGVLGGHLGEPVEVLDVGARARGTSPAAAMRARARRTPPLRGRSRPRSPAAPISTSSAATRSASPAGSKIVREQAHLLTDRGQARGVDSLGAVAAMAPTLSANVAIVRARLGLGAVALLELLAAPAPARVVAADLVLLVDDALLDDGRGLRILRLRSP